MLIVGYETTHKIEHNGQEINTSYRLERLGIGEIGWWSYKPEHRDYWTEVKSYDICRLLDRGLHPRDFEILYAIKQNKRTLEGVS